MGCDAAALQEDCSFDTEGTMCAQECPECDECPELPQLCEDGNKPTIGAGRCDCAVCATDVEACPALSDIEFCEYVEGKAGCEKDCCELDIQLCPDETLAGPWNQPGTLHCDACLNGDEACEPLLPGCWSTGPDCAFDCVLVPGDSNVLHPCAFVQGGASAAPYWDPTTGIWDCEACPEQELCDVPQHGCTMRVACIEECPYSAYASKVYEEHVTEITATKPKVVAYTGGAYGAVSTAAEKPDYQDKTSETAETAGTTEYSSTSGASTVSITWAMVFSAASCYVVITMGL